jgi:hypothetical protein
MVALGVVGRAVVDSWAVVDGRSAEGLGVAGRAVVGAVVPLAAEVAAPGVQAAVASSAAVRAASRPVRDESIGR